MPLRMSAAYRPPTWRSRSTLLVALLALTLALAAMLAYEAHAAARSHRATAERALRDYATVAAWELLAGGADRVQDYGAAAFAPIVGVRLTTPFAPLPGPATLAATADTILRCAAPLDDARRFYFRTDFRDGTLATSGAPLSAADRATVLRTITDHARASYRPDWNGAVVLAPTPRPVLLAYAVMYAEHGAPIAAFGVGTCPSALGAGVFAPIMAHHALLPATLTRGEPNDSLVAVSVFDAAGDTVYRSAARGPSPFTADASLPAVGGLTARAALRPRAIAALAIGAPPGSKLPLLLGLLALTAGLVVVAVLQLRREQELARLRSDFISGVSHELRTPLAQILLFAETLSLGRVRSDEERRSAADIIVQEGRRLMQLVENVLHFSRAERRMTRLRPEPTPLAPVVRDAIAAWRALAGDVDATVRATLDESLVAHVDPGALRQVIVNLLDNAVKYGPRRQTVEVALSSAGMDAAGSSTAGVAGSRRTALGVRPREAPSVERREPKAERPHPRPIILSITDQGPGIPPRERARIWEPFYRLARDLDSAVTGSGIGLYVVRELAERQGGRARVEGAGGGGARFVIELPGARLDAWGEDATPGETRARPTEATAIGTTRSVG